MFRPLTTTLILCTALGAGAAFADSHNANPAVKARQAHMQLYLHNLIPMIQMIRGTAEYDAEAATARASNIAALTQLDQSTYWVPGTDSDALPGQSKALPALWDNIPDAIAKGQAVAEAAANLAATAGDGPDALRAGFGPLNTACNACHEDYQLVEE
ncbi:MAG: cytochrome c [Pseudomonadota bacterium]